MHAAYQGGTSVSERHILQLWPYEKVSDGYECMNFCKYLHTIAIQR